MNIQKLFSIYLDYLISITALKTVGQLIIMKIYAKSVSAQMIVHIIKRLHVVKILKYQGSIEWLVERPRMAQDD